MATIAISGCQTSNFSSFDTVIRNGTVVDGSGLGSYRADVGIVRGRIAFVGRLRAAVDTETVGAGLLAAVDDAVAPARLGIWIRRGAV